MLKVTVPDATHSCKDGQLCAVLKVVIDVEVHWVRSIWGSNSTKENEDILLIDAKNSFNEMNHIRMLWMVCHIWPSRASFVFNCYSHWPYFPLKNGDGATNILHSKEGVTLEDLLDMVDYGIVVLLLIKRLKAAYPDVTQIWCFDSSVALGMFYNV